MKYNMKAIYHLVETVQEFVSVFLQSNVSSFNSLMDARMNDTKSMNDDSIHDVLN